MSDIEVVINIPKRMYNMIKNKLYCGIHDVKVYEAIIRKGIPLPEDHGKLNDAVEITKALEQEPYKDMGDVSDGYHTFNQLYHQRAILFATIVNQNKDIAWKSYKHSDGKYCFDSNGEWFIVGVDTPKGSYTYHYSKEYWNMFDCKELEYGKEWDGHTEEDVTRLLSLEQESKTNVVDNIKAEIQEKINYNKKMNYQGIVAGLLLALNIINKYKTEKSEE